MGCSFRERKMNTNFVCTNFLNTARGPGHPGKISGTSQIPLFETQGRQTFEGGHELFGHHPFAWKNPTPPGGLRTQKLNLRALFSCLIFARFRPFSANSRQKQPKSTQNRLLLKGLIRVLDGAGEGLCGWKSGHNSKVLLCFGVSGGSQKLEGH